MRGVSHTKTPFKIFKSHSSQDLELKIEEQTELGSNGPISYTKKIYKHNWDLTQAQLFATDNDMSDKIIKV